MFFSCLIYNLFFTLIYVVLLKILFGLSKKNAIFAKK